jgi:hypothetical protein
VLDVNHDQRFWPDGLRNDVVLRHRALDVNHDQRFWPDGLRSGEVLHRRELGVSHDRMRVPGVSHGQKFWPGGLHEFRVVRGRRSETCCDVQEVLGSSRVACRHRLLGERRVNHASHELGVHHGRRCAERGLPNVMKVRQLLLREACVVRDLRLPKHPCGELI